MTSAASTLPPEGGISSKRHSRKKSTTKEDQISWQGVMGRKQKKSDAIPSGSTDPTHTALEKPIYESPKFEVSDDDNSSDDHPGAFGSTPASAHKEESLHFGFELLPS